jgi:hypothetical protein
MSLADPRARYATLALDGRVRLHGEHKGRPAAYAAFRDLEEQGQPCVLVRLEDHNPVRPVTILAACGVDADRLERDPAFLDDMRRVCRVVRARY